MGRRKRRRAPEGSVDWVYVADLAAIRKCSRWTARTVVLKVRALFGAEQAQKVERRGRPMWRVRTEAVRRYFESRRSTTEERLLALEGKVADLQGEIEERDARIDALALDVRRALDLSGNPRRIVSPHHRAG